VRAQSLAALPALALLLLPAAVAAHRGHASLAVVAVPVKGDVITITHRMTAHDVEPALVAIAPDAQPSLDDAEALAAFTRYVAQNCRIAGVPLALTSQALDGDDVRLVYTGRLKRGTKALDIACALFGETWRGHHVQVNVQSGGITRTLHFRPGTGPQRVPLAGR
jgi:hypothetical protein